MHESAVRLTISEIAFPILLLLFILVYYSHFFYIIYQT